MSSVESGAIVMPGSGHRWLGLAVAAAYLFCAPPSAMAFSDDFEGPGFLCNVFRKTCPPGTLAMPHRAEPVTPDARPVSRNRVSKTKSVKPADVSPAKTE